MCLVIYGRGGLVACASFPAEREASHCGTAFILFLPPSPSIGGDQRWGQAANCGASKICANSRSCGLDDQKSKIEAWQTAENLISVLCRTITKKSQYRKTCTVKNTPLILSKRGVMPSSPLFDLHSAVYSNRVLNFTLMGHKDIILYLYGSIIFCNLSLKCG